LSRKAEGHKTGDWTKQITSQRASLRSEAGSHWSAVSGDSRDFHLSHGKREKKGCQMMAFSKSYKRCSEMKKKGKGGGIVFLKFFFQFNNGRRYQKE
jgi:hypothetical protein